MSHPHEDQLLLHAYGELAGPQAAEVEEHLAACAACRAAVRALAEAGEAAQWAMERPVPGRWPRTAWAAVPLAAALGALLLWQARGRSAAPEPPAWQPHLVASPAAGYVTGGAAFMTIDSQLVRLEHRRGYGSLD